MTIELAHSLTYFVIMYISRLSSQCSELNVHIMGLRLRTVNVKFITYFYIAFSFTKN